MNTLKDFLVKTRDTQVMVKCYNLSDYGAALHAILRVPVDQHLSEGVARRAGRTIKFHEPVYWNQRALGMHSPMAQPDGQNPRWVLNFVSYAFDSGCFFRMLTMIAVRRAVWPLTRPNVESHGFPTMITDIFRVGHNAAKLHTPTLMAIVEQDLTEI